MKFKIDPKIFEQFNVKIGILVANNIDNTKETDEIMQLQKSIYSEIRTKFESIQLSEHPKIKPWRLAFSKFGGKPKKNKSSVEALTRRIAKGGELPHINNLVDIYNYVSLKHTLPLGGDDIDKVDGNIILTFAKGDETFQELNSDEIKNPKQGEVIYRDGKEVLCRRWNWRECDKSKITKETKNVCLVVEAMEPATLEELNNTLTELKQLVEKYCGGEIKTFILDKENCEVEIK